MLLLLARAVLRHAAVAAGAVLLVMAAILAIGQGARHATEAVGGELALALMLWLMSRVGLLAAVVTLFVLGAGSLVIPATLDLSAWYGQAALTWLT